MRLAFRLLTWAVLACAPLGPARAQSLDCRHLPDIVAAADFLLHDPKNEQRFWRDHAATDAAFLLIRYGELRYETGMRLIDGLRQRRVPPQRIGDLRLAFARPGERLAMLDDMQEGASVPPGGPSFFRAMVVDGRDDWLFHDMARRAALPNADQRAVVMFQLRLAAAFADLDDEIRTKIAVKAEARGLWPLARELLARKADPRDWLALIRRSPEAPNSPDKLAELFGPLWRGHATLRPRPYQLDSLPPELRAAAEALDARRHVLSEHFDAVSELVAAAPQAHPLLTVLNQTGEPRLGSDVAAPLLRDIRAGTLNPTAEPDALLVRIMEGMTHVLGPDTTWAQLQSFRMPASLSPGETALAVMERAVARQTLAPLVRGDVNGTPGRPELLSSGFDWAGWRNVAESIRTGKAIHHSYRAVEAELLQAAYRYAAAINALAAMGPTDEARRRAHGLLLTLDQLCAGLMWPAPIVGEPIYRFPPRAN